MPLHLLMMCHVLVRHRKHYNVCSMFAVNIHENGISALMQNKSYILEFSLNPREKNLIYNWHIGDDKIPSSDNCCHLGIEGSLSKYTHFFLFIFWWHQIFSFPFCFSLLVFPTLQWHIYIICSRENHHEFFYLDM